MPCTSCCDDAVDEDSLILCCALGCANCSIYNSCDCVGTSAKVRILACKQLY